MRIDCTVIANLKENYVFVRMIWAAQNEMISLKEENITNK